MFLVVGLGNPGKKYEDTRHNIGVKAIDEIAANFQFPIFNFQSIFNAKISKGTINNQEITLVKPQTFMNKSGIAVKKLIKNRASACGSEGEKEDKVLFDYLKLEIGNLVVINDDIDLPVGKIRIAKNRGAAGHKGVESVIKELGTKNFIRIRIGIKPKFGKPKSPEKFVLQKFNKEEREIIKEATKNAAEAVELFLEKGLEKAMSEFNRLGK